MYAKTTNTRQHNVLVALPLHSHTHSCSCCLVSRYDSVDSTAAVVAYQCCLPFFLFLLLFLSSFTSTWLQQQYIRRSAVNVTQHHRKYYHHFHQTANQYLAGHPRRSRSQTKHTFNLFQTLFHYLFLRNFASQHQSY